MGWRTQSVSAIWPEMQAYLERRSQELQDEVRHYPTPIARCDEQLTKLIEQRQRALHLLQLLGELNGSDRETMERFLLAPAIDADDERESSLRLCLRTRY